MRPACVVVVFALALGCRAQATAADAGGPRLPYSRVDVHVHASPDLYPVVFKIFDAVSVQRFVNLSGGPPGDGLEETLAAGRAFGGRIATCTNLNGRHLAHNDFGERFAADLRRAASAGAVCLKIPKAFGLAARIQGEEALLAIDDPRFDPLWAAAGALSMPVFIHVADPKAFWEPVTPDNERFDELNLHPAWSFSDPRFPRREALLAQFENVLRRHGGTRFVGVHFGNDPEDIDATDRRLDAFPNLLVDTAARVPEIGRAPPEKLRAFFVKHQDRVLFGTDLGVTHGGVMLGSTDDKEPTFADARRFFALHWRFFETADRGIPHPTPIQGRWTVNAIALPDAVLRKFYERNAMRLLRWPASSPAAPPMRPTPP